MVDVVISYSKTDVAAVRRLADSVRQLGYDVWWDEEPPPHLSWSDFIAERIGAAKAAIVVWSENAAASQAVRAEADLARHQAKLIQASVDGRMPPMPFNQLQFAAIGDWRGEEDHQGWIKIKASLALLCGREVPPVPPPAVPQPQPSAPAPAGTRLVPVLVGLLLLVLLLVAYLLWSRR